MDHGRDLFWPIPVALYVADHEGRFVDGNPALLDLFGAPAPEHLMARSPTELWADPARRAEELQRLQRDGAVQGVDLTVRGANGQPRVVRDACVLVRGPCAPEAAVAGVLVDITDVREEQEQLRRLAVRDPLTGCYNRRFLLSLEDRLAATGDPWSVIMIDIDDFKGYNDRHGHRKGDEILMQLARFLMQQVRAHDAVVRLGGDEFVVLLMGNDAPFTDIVRNRLQVAAGAAAPVAFSMGWAVKEPGDALEDTIARADGQLIQVKVETHRRAPKRRRSGDFPMSEPDA